MGLLTGTSVYLAGAIDFHKDPRSWRRNITNDLLNGLGIKVYDPLVKPSWLGEQSFLEPSKFSDAIKDAVNGKFSSENDSIFEHGIKQVRRIDLRFAHDCNFMICSVPKVFTSGTFEELSIAVNAGKPVLFHMPDGVVSTWLPSQVSDTLYDYVGCHFGDWPTLYDYIRKVDLGIIGVDNFKWIFLSYHYDNKVKRELNK